MVSSFYAREPFRLHQADLSPAPRHLKYSVCTINLPYPTNRPIYIFVIIIVDWRVNFSVYTHDTPKELSLNNLVHRTQTVHDFYRSLISSTLLIFFQNTL